MIGEIEQIHQWMVLVEGYDKVWRVMVVNIVEYLVEDKKRNGTKINLKKDPKEI